MKITNVLYLETRVYSKDEKEAWLVNTITGKEVKVASVCATNGKWLVGDMYRSLIEQSRGQAMHTFDYNVQMTVANLMFLYSE